MEVDSKGAHLIKNNHIIYTAKFENGSFVMHATSCFSQKEGVRAYTLTTGDPNLVHYGMGHASLPYLLRAGLVKSSDVLSYCTAYAKGKLKRAAKTRRIGSDTSTFVPTAVGEKMHFDVMGKLPRSIDNRVFLLTSVNQFSRYGFVFPLSHKLAVPRTIIQHITTLQRTIKLKTGNYVRVRVIKTDNGTEFLNSTLASFLSAGGIAHEKSTAYMPSENG